MAYAHGNGALTTRSPEVLLIRSTSLTGRHTMSTLDPHTLISRRLLFVGGKGGVGKTTVAAALGGMAAGQGKRCLVVSTDPAHSLGDAFGQTIGGHVVPLQERLFGLEIDPDAEADRYVSSVSERMKAFASHQMHQQIDRQMALARFSPGAAEAALLERVATIMTTDADAYDLVIFDTAPTGHTLRLLTLPETMAAWTEGLMASGRRSGRLGEAVANLTTRREAAGVASPTDDPHDRPFAGLDRRAQRIAEALLERRRLFSRSRRILVDPTLTAFVFVVAAERLPVLETVRAVAALRKFEVPVAGLIVNRLMPHLDGAFYRSRAEQEDIYLSMLASELPELPRMRVPMLARDVSGQEALAAFAAMLEDPDGFPDRPEAPGA
jgi:arsenite/tail-anchored protein-transporting ATPase